MAGSQNSPTCQFKARRDTPFWVSRPTGCFGQRLRLATLACLGTAAGDGPHAGRAIWGQAFRQDLRPKARSRQPVSSGQKLLPDFSAAAARPFGPQCWAIDANQPAKPGKAASGRRRRGYARLACRLRRQARQSRKSLKRPAANGTARLCAALQQAKHAPGERGEVVFGPSACFSMPPGFWTQAGFAGWRHPSRRWGAPSRQVGLRFASAFLAAALPSRSQPPYVAAA